MKPEFLEFLDTSTETSAAGEPVTILHIKKTVAARKKAISNIYSSSALTLLHTSIFKEISTLQSIAPFLRNKMTGPPPTKPEDLNLN